MAAASVWGSVIGAGFALPRDAGQRPAVQAGSAVRADGVCADGGAVGAGFALRSLALDCYGLVGGASGSKARGWKPGALMMLALLPVARMT